MPAVSSFVVLTVILCPHTVQLRWQPGVPLSGGDSFVLSGDTCTNDRAALRARRLLALVYMLT
jgi:hypothetical protein